MFSVNGIYSHIVRNNMKSLMLFLVFIVTFHMVTLAFSIPILIIFDRENSAIYDLKAYFVAYAPIITLLGISIFCTMLWRFLGHISRATNAQSVTERNNPRLFKLVRNLSIQMGLPVPHIGLIDSPVRNAYACGLTIKNSKIVVTAGLLDALNDNELQAVLAHEMSHIANHDMRLLAIATILTRLTELVNNYNPFARLGTKRLIFLAVIPIFWIVFLTCGVLSAAATMLGQMARFMISRSREFIADATAVDITKNPVALVSALRKIDGCDQVSGLGLAYQAIMISGVSEGSRATHPTIAERVEVIKHLTGSMVVEKSEPIATAFNRMPQNAAKPAARKQNAFSVVNADSGKTFLSIPIKSQLSIFSILLIIAVPIGLKMAYLNTAVANFERLGNVSSDTPKSRSPSAATLNHQLSLLPVSRSRCFKGAFRIDSLSPTKLKKSNGVVLINMAQPIQTYMGVSIEKWLNGRNSTLRKVYSARQAGNSEALQDAVFAYIELRALNLVNSYRFFGREGYEYMQGVYRQSSDQAVRNDILNLFEAGKLDYAKAATESGKSMLAKAYLLVRGESEFVPCDVRGLEQMQTTNANLDGNYTSATQP